MDEETKEFLKSEFKRVYDNIGELKSQVGGLENQVGINCKKLDDMDKKLDSIVEITTANGQGIEVLSVRLDKLE